jgi:hypothetical protein
MNKRNKIMAAFAAALAAGSIGVGVTTASATPPTPIAAGSIGVGVTTAPAAPATPPPSADMRWAQLVELIRV